MMLRRFTHVHSQSADAESTSESTQLDQVVDNLRFNFKKTLRTSNEVRSSRIKQVRDYIPVVTSDKNRQRNPKAADEDADVDTEIKKLIERKELDKALAHLTKSSIENRYPSRRTLGVLASLCANNGDIANIDVIRAKCEVAFPVESVHQMQFKHYQAEALWKIGLYSESLDLFYDLYVHHPHNRRKLINLQAFCMRHVINEKLVKIYPKLLEFVSSISKFNDLMPAANLWRLAFCSNSFETQRISETLLELYPKLLEILPLKFSAILEEAKTYGNIDLFQRLMALAIRLNWKDSYSNIFGTYVDYLCSINDVNGVRESLKYVSNNSIIIPASSMERSLALIVGNRVNVSDSQKKTGKSLSEKLLTKFKF